MGTTTEQKGQERICELENRTIEITHSEQKSFYKSGKKWTDLRICGMLTEVEYSVTEFWQNKKERQDQKYWEK